MKSSRKRLDFFRNNRLVYEYLTIDSLLITMKLTLNYFNSLISLVNHFNSDKRCRDFITEQRWGGNVVCPFCGCTHTYVCSYGDNQFKCADCKKRFFVLWIQSSTIQNSHFKSALWPCILYILTRRVSHHAIMYVACLNVMMFDCFNKYLKFA